MYSPSKRGENQEKLINTEHNTYVPINIESIFIFG